MPTGGERGTRYWFPSIIPAMPPAALFPGDCPILSRKQALIRTITKPLLQHRDRIFLQQECGGIKISYIQKPKSSICMNRREILKTIPLLPLVAAAPSMLVSASPTPPVAGRDLFAELGVTKVINADVTMTFLSGSLMLPEVLEAINSTSHDFANMFDLQDKVGAKIAEMLKVEAAMVTSGAACAILLGTAASITGTDKEKIRMIPNLPGPVRK